MLPFKQTAVHPKTKNVTKQAANGPRTSHRPRVQNQRQPAVLDPRHLRALLRLRLWLPLRPNHLPRPPTPNPAPNPTPPQPQLHVPLLLPPPALQNRPAKNSAARRTRTVPPHAATVP